jgi:hypothetical protein
VSAEGAYLREVLFGGLQGETAVGAVQVAVGVVVVVVVAVAGPGQHQGRRQARVEASLGVVVRVVARTQARVVGADVVELRRSGHKLVALKDRRCTPSIPFS